MVQGKINKGRHINHPARRNSIRTKQCPAPPSPCLEIKPVGIIIAGVFHRLEDLPVILLALSKHQLHPVASLIPDPLSNF